MIRRFEGTCILFYKRLCVLFFKMIYKEFKNMHYVQFLIYIDLNISKKEKSKLEKN